MCFAPNCFLPILSTFTSYGNSAMHPKDLNRPAPRFVFNWDPARNQMRVNLLRSNSNSLTANDSTSPQQDQPDPRPTTRATSAQKAAQH